MPEANLVGKPGVDLPKPDSARGRVKGPVWGLPKRPPIAGMGTGDQAIYTQNNIGISGAHDVQTDLVIPSQYSEAIIYAPTSLPAGYACIEATTVHRRTSSGMEHASAFYNHCGLYADGFMTWEQMNSTWKQKYARVYDGEERYWMEVAKGPTGCWIGYLYNFQLGQWEKKTDAICRTGPFSYGWTAWESWDLMDRYNVCPTFPSIESLDIYVMGSDQVWRLLTGNYVQAVGGSPHLCWKNGTYNLHVHQSHYRWHAHTPSP